MQIAFYTLGCKVNQYETQAMEQLALQRGHSLVPFEGPADVYVINTCSVTAVSDKKSRQMIRRARKQAPDSVVAVCGCYPQTHPGEVEKLGVDLISGTGDRTGFVELLEEAAEKKGRIEAIDQSFERRVFEVLPAGGLEGRTRAMLKMEDGCVNFCSYCIIPYARGRIRSPPVEDCVRQARELVEQRKHEQKMAASAPVGKVSLEDLFSQIKQGEMKDLNIIVKADVQGSAEAVKASLEKLSNEEVRVRVIHCAVGAISESDVMLATTSNAIIVGFNVRPDNNAKESAARNNVDMRMYRVIYDCINEIETAMKGMLAPKFKEVELGQAEVRNVFRITGVGMVAGCYVTNGKMQRGAQMRLLRDNIVIYDGAIASLQRFKDSVKEVAQGYECGITFEKFQDIKEGDVIEAYLMEQIEV